MEELTNEASQASEKRPRKKPSQIQIFKETYLPFVIIALAAILIITFIIGSVSRANAKRKAETEASIAASEALAQLNAELEAEAERLLSQAENYASQWDYQSAVSTLESFSGDMSKFPQIAALRDTYLQIMSELTVYSDPGVVPQLSFQMLIADPDRAFNDDTYGYAYLENYITTDEFSEILQQLYDGGYMLVGLHDLVEETDNGNGTVSFEPGRLQMPVGKKPIVLTQTAVNYFTYMTDGDGDGLPDKDGDGFPYCLALDENGNFTSKMIDADGNDITGNFDFVTILEQFISEHPDFSYQGARAVLALTAYDGLFGYRIHPSVREAQGTEYYAQQLAGANQIADALESAGYEFACYSYEHVSYGEGNFEYVLDDLARWEEEAEAILGDVDIFVYPYGEDLTESIFDTYEGERYDALYNAGFRIFVGMDHSQPAMANVTDYYFRHTRRLVNGLSLMSLGEDFSDVFDTDKVISSSRYRESEETEE